MRQPHTSAINEAAMHEASTAQPSIFEMVGLELALRALELSVKVSQLAEHGEAVVNFLARQLLQPLGSEAFASV